MLDLAMIMHLVKVKQLAPRNAEYSLVFGHYNLFGFQAFSEGCNFYLDNTKP